MPVKLPRKVPTKPSSTIRPSSRPPARSRSSSQLKRFLSGSDSPAGRSLANHDSVFLPPWLRGRLTIVGLTAGISTCIPGTPPCSRLERHPAPVKPPVPPRRSSPSWILVSAIRRGQPRLARHTDSGVCSVFPRLSLSIRYQQANQPTHRLGFPGRGPPGRWDRGGPGQTPTRLIAPSTSRPPPCRAPTPASLRKLDVWDGIRDSPTTKTRASARKAAVSPSSITMMPPVWRRLSTWFCRGFRARSSASVPCVRARLDVWCGHGHDSCERAGTPPIARRLRARGARGASPLPDPSRR